MHSHVIRRINGCCVHYLPRCSIILDCDCMMMAATKHAIIQIGSTALFGALVCTNSDEQYISNTASTVNEVQLGMHDALTTV